MKKDNTNSYTVEVKPLPESMVEITGEISWEGFMAYEKKALGRLGERLELDGFRKGNVPEDIARKHIPDELILGDMAELALGEMYPSIVKEHKLDVIGRPEVSITKLARDNALGFTIRAAVVPEIKLPDYKKLASSVTLSIPKDVTDADVDKVVNELRQMRAYGHVHAEGDAHVHDEPLPEANDEFAKSFGAFQSMDELRAKVRENLMLEAEQATKDKRRIGIMEAIIGKTEFTIPAVILQSENEKMFATLEADIARSGASLEEYLGHIKKTKEELLAEFAPEAEKRARFQLVLNAISRDASIATTDEEVAVEAEKFMAMYPGADLERTKAYADMVLTNEKVLGMLEGK